MLTALALLGLALAGLYAAVTVVNLSVFCAPPSPVSGTSRPAISVLIPARDEQANIGAALDAVLASREVVLEVVVLDDSSTDATAAIVAKRAAGDPRLRLIAGTPLPRGAIGKPHACAQLAEAARHPLLVFVDADVRLVPDALARIAAWLDRHRLDLASGFPHQITGTPGEALVIPQILVLLLGYLPFPMARRSPKPSFAAGCGQLIAVRRAAYEASGGHRAFRGRMHDGLLLPRAVRMTGGRTDIFDATDLAVCRMYDSWQGVWAGFAKNAAEGMATPRALPVWTLLLGGGHVLPFLLVPLAVPAGGLALGLALASVALVWGARIALALRVRQSALSVLLHPAGVAVVLAIQWSALWAAREGRRVAWRGRSYEPPRP